MKSHEYAEKLKAAADFLLAREDAELTSTTQVCIPLFYWSKESFVAAVRTFGPGVKEWKDDDLRFTPNGPCNIFLLAIRRQSVCRLVKAAEYECEPILSDAEVAAL